MALIDVFLDTNILFYAAQSADREPHKKAVSRYIVAQQDYGTSVQVLAEFYVNVINKGPQPLTSDKARQWVAAIARKPCQDIDAALVRAAIELSQRYQISYWDAAIIEAARRLGAKVVYSEDLNHEQVYAGVNIINPFR